MTDKRPRNTGIPAARAETLDPLAMTVAQMSAVLSAVGLGAVGEDLIRRHLADGAPTAGDGRINLVHYCAWINQYTSSGPGKNDHGA